MGLRREAADGGDDRGGDKDGDRRKKRNDEPERVPDKGAMLLHLKYAKPAKDKRPIYYIGPFGSRVSFQSQQRRALNVVGSLMELREISSETDIVIVGAGVAGMTAFAALSSGGYKVRLYERNSAVLTLQEGSTHRYIHPTVNFWPDTDADRTTRLPFFDWYSSDCPNVIETFRHQWDHDADKVVRRDPRLPKKVKDLTQSDPLFEYDLKFQAYDPVSKRVSLVDETRKEIIEADLVLVAIGFGVEDNLGDESQRPYWKDDRLVNLASQEGQEILISGAGDGGLIDCLRLVYGGFKKGDFALDVIDALECGPYSPREAFQALEDDARKESDVNRRAELFAERYAALLPKLNRSARDLLEHALIKKASGGFPNKIRLLGRFSAPYELGAAPINRLLLAFALSHKALTFEHGSLERVEGAYYLKKKGRKTAVPGKVKVIVRHGPLNALGGFLTKNEVKSLREQQQEPEDFASEGSFPNKYFVPANTEYPCRFRTPGAFANIRWPLAYRFLSERFGAVTKVGGSDPEPCFVVDDVISVPEVTHADIADLPRHVFGIPVERRQRPKGQDTSAAPLP